VGRELGNNKNADDLGNEKPDQLQKKPKRDRVNVPFAAPMTLYI